jgi:hypothetical protein
VSSSVGAASVEEATTTTTPWQDKQRAEIKARDRHDNLAMNALFVNVNEYPKPEACVMELGRIPADLRKSIENWTQWCFP